MLGDLLATIQILDEETEILATSDGVVSDILAEDSALVEFGQSLVRLGPVQ